MTLYSAHIVCPSPEFQVRIHPLSVRYSRIVHTANTSRLVGETHELPAVPTKKSTPERPLTHSLRKAIHNMANIIQLLEEQIQPHEPTREAVYIHTPGNKVGWSIIFDQVVHLTPHAITNKKNLLAGVYTNKQKKPATAKTITKDPIRKKFFEKSATQS
jgi:hypothetical protein